MKLRIGELYKSLFAIILAVSIVSFPSGVYGDTQLGEISVYFNGQLMEFDQPPIIVNNRTMVPFRAIFEAFGADVEWNQEQQRVIAVHDNSSHIVLDIGSEKAFVNGQTHHMDAAPIVMPETSRTLVPIRFISEAFGADVEWDNDSRNVNITMDLMIPRTPQWEDYIDEIAGGGTAIDPEEYEATGEWHPIHRNSIVGGYYYNVRGWRMSLANYQEMIAERDRIVAQIISPGMSEYEIIRAAHDWLVYNVSYNTDAWSRQRLEQTGSGWNPDWRPARYPQEHQMAWSAFMLRTTVCAGYADALIYLLEPFGVKAMYVSGPLFNQGFSEGSHAWNLVRMDGKWYHIDAAWNRFYSGGHHMVAYTWFLLSDDDVRNTGQITRSWSMSQYPSAPNTFELNRPGLIWDHGLNRWRSRTPQDDVQFNITASANLQNSGRVTANPSASRPGQWVTLNAQANPGFEFERWEVVSGGIRFHRLAGSSATFLMPENNVSVRAIFRQIQSTHTVSLSVSNFQAGTAGASPYVNVRQGDWVGLQAYANPGFEFERWEVVSGVANIQNLNLDSTGFVMPSGDVSIRAMFRQVQGKTVSVGTDDAQQGTFSANPSSNVAPGAWVSLQANAGSGFEFDRWEVVSGTVQIQNIFSASTGFHMPDSEVAVRAVFRPSALQAFSVNVSVNNVAAGTAAASPAANAVQGTQINLQAIAASGFQFERWEVVSGTVQIQNPNSASTSFQMPLNNVSVRAVFAQTQTFSVNVSVDSSVHGAAQASPSANLSPGSSVTLSAMPNAGYVFSRWEIISGGNISFNSTSPQVTFLMPANNVSLRAVFEPVAAPTFSVTVSVSNALAGSASVSSNTAAAGDMVTLTAFPNTDFTFSHWQEVSGNAVISNANSATAGFVMPMGNVAVMAVFIDN